MGWQDPAGKSPRNQLSLQGPRLGQTVAWALGFLQCGLCQLGDLCPHLLPWQPCQGVPVCSPPYPAPILIGHLPHAHPSCSHSVPPSLAEGAGKFPAATECWQPEGWETEGCCPRPATAAARSLPRLRSRSNSPGPGLGSQATIAAIRSSRPVWCRGWTELHPKPSWPCPSQEQHPP